MDGAREQTDRNTVATTRRDYLSNASDIKALLTKQSALFLPMNSYILPRSVNELFGLVECMLEGMRAYEDALELPADLTIPLLCDALANARNSCQALKADTKQGPAYADVYKRANAATKPFFPVAKEVLSRYLGSRWSQKWKQIGWITRRGAPPVSPRQRELLLAALWHYFKANPTHQDAGRGVTMEAIVRYHNPLREARLALEAYDGNLAKVRRTGPGP